jgi:hypothetical protein
VHVAVHVALLEFVSRLNARAGADIPTGIGKAVKALNRHKETDMPAISKAQQKAAGAALAAKRGDESKSKLKGASKQMEDSMSEKQLEDFARTKRKSLPDKKD